MRKLLYLLVASLFVFACDDEDDGGGKPPYYHPFELAGNIYYQEVKSSEGDPKLFRVFEFKSETNLEYLQRKGSVEGEQSVAPETYSYIFDYPAINMYPPTGNLVTATFNVDNPDSLYVAAKGGWFHKWKE